MMWLRVARIMAFMTPLGKYGSRTECGADHDVTKKSEWILPEGNGD